MSITTPFSYQGSKLKEINKLSEFIPKKSKIIEPFIGTGIVSHYFGRDNSCLGNDYNLEIYHIWFYIKEQNSEFIALCRDFMQEDNKYQEYYYNKRDEYNNLWKLKSENSPLRSALFYYLINSCHAGMIRYGPNGFNTSYNLFLSNGNNYNIEERINLFYEISKKFNRFESKDAIKFLLDNEKNLHDYDIIYCDPPYTASAAPYISAWDDEKLVELDNILYTFSEKHDIYCIMSNFYSDKILQLKGKISKSFNSSRMAGTKTVTKKDVILTYGNPPKKGLERV